MTPAIRCAGLTKRFGSVLAVDSLDLEIRPGEVFGFLGPNGAGKTTTIGMLVGLIPPTAGSAEIAGRSIRDGDNRRSIGYLPQEPALYGWMKGREFLDFTGALFGLSREERGSRAGRLLGLLGLEEAAGRKLGGYSGGMKKRLALAAALMNDPQVLILDEPVNDLDPLGRREVLEILGSLGAEKTVLMSTHVLADADRICDTVGIIHKGRLLVHSPIEELRNRFAQPTFVLEVEDGAGALAERLKAAEWVTWVKADGRSVRFMASDAAAARRETAAVVAGAGVSLVSWNSVTPSLEDIFVRLVSGEDTE